MDYEDSESEESSEGEDGIDKQDPLWNLYAQVRYYKTGSGNPVAEPFLQLPSKRELPDYYESIKNPISLNMVRETSGLSSLFTFLFTFFVVYRSGRKSKMAATKRQPSSRPI